MNDVNFAVGEQIRRVRKAHKLTMEQLGERVHKSKSTIAKYESGEVCIDIETLLEISRALTVHVFELLGPAALYDTVRTSSTHNELFPRLYLYYYDGRKKRVRFGVISPYEVIDDERQRVWCNINVGESQLPLGVEYSLDGVLSVFKPFISISITASGFDSGNYSNVMIYAYNFLETNQITKGIITGLFKNPFAPGVTKAILSKRVLSSDELLDEVLRFSKQEIQQIKQLNIFTIENVF